MRVRLVALTLAIAGVCLFAGSQLPAPAQQQQQQQAEAIDFDALHAQAQAALTSLQQSRDARVASVASTAF
jgi:precorrin-4 methylase